VYYLLICSAIFITVINSEYSLFLSDFERGVLSLIRISVLSLKDSAYFTDRYSYKYNTEINEISLISI